MSFMFLLLKCISVASPYLAGAKLSILDSAVFPFTSPWGCILVPGVYAGPRPWGNYHMLSSHLCVLAFSGMSHCLLGMGCWCLMGTEFQLGTMKTFWRWMDGWRYLMPQNCTLKMVKMVTFMDWIFYHNLKKIFFFCSQLHSLVEWGNCTTGNKEIAKNKKYT